MENADDSELTNKESLKEDEKTNEESVKRKRNVDDGDEENEIDPPDKKSKMDTEDNTESQNDIVTKPKEDEESSKIEKESENIVKDEEIERSPTPTSTKSESKDIVAEDVKNIMDDTSKSETNKPVSEDSNEDSSSSSLKEDSKSSNESQEQKSILQNGTSGVSSSVESETSSLKSEDSEKENRMEVDSPIDLSKKPSNDPMTNGGTDVITLSDSDEEILNGIFKEPSIDEILKRKKMVKILQEELRNEEAKLVLLKKLRQSQLGSQFQEHPPNYNNKNSSAPSNNNHPTKAHSSQPPPLVRGSQNQQQFQGRQAHNQPPQMTRGLQGPPSGRSHQQGPPPLVNMGGRERMSSSDRRSHMDWGRGMSGSASNNSHTIQHRANQSSPAHNQSRQELEQSPAQRQAAAKMALRKQLEKTLLQIPHPKPPPPEMNFIPSLSSPDFIYLLGLEEAVNYIIDAALISKGQKSADEKMVCTPFTCVQCNTDFTPVWKREKAGSKNVICEVCVTTNQKKALKQEHTNRLKSAFVKALQQEQEIEKMQAQAPTTGSSSSSSHSSNSTSHNSGGSSSSSHQSGVSAMYNRTASAETLRHHQNFIQAHQAVAAHQTALRMGQPLGLAPFAGARGFPYQLPYGMKPSDLQRQYLLDMIPNRSAMSWNK